MRSNVPVRPGWIEIVLGAVLAVLLGLLLAGLFLIVKPTENVRQVPKELKADTVYYVEGRKDYQAGQRWRFKREALLAGQTVRVTEDEVNQWLEASYPPPAPTPEPPKTPAKGDGKDGAKETPSEPLLRAGTPNFRLAGEEVALAYPIIAHAFGHKRQIIVQSIGRIEKVKGAIRYNPREIYIGSMPIHRLRPIKRFLFGQLANRFEYPAPIVAAWEKLDHVSIEGRELVLQAVPASPAPEK